MFVGADARQRCVCACICSDIYIYIYMCVYIQVLTVEGVVCRFIGSCRVIHTLLTRLTRYRSSWRCSCFYRCVIFFPPVFVQRFRRLDESCLDYITPHVHRPCHSICSTVLFRCPLQFGRNQRSVVSRYVAPRCQCSA